MTWLGSSAPRCTVPVHATAGGARSCIHAQAHGATPSKQLHAQGPGLGPLHVCAGALTAYYVRNFPSPVNQPGGAQGLREGASQGRGTRELADMPAGAGGDRRRRRGPAFNCWQRGGMAS